MKVFVCILALFAVASAAQPGNRNLLTDVIKNIFENNKDKLANLQIELIDLAEFGTVNNLQFTNLENIVIDRLDSEGPLSVDIKNGTASLNTGSATGSFVFNNVEEPALGLLLNGAGDLSGTANGIWATIKLNCKLQGLTFQVVDFSELQIRIDQIDAALTGIDNAEAQNAIINTDLAPWLGANLPTIAYENKVVILEKINEILAGLTF